MSWVYISPHFDDVALSCGGLVWEQLHSGQEVEIWTICAGEPRAGEPLSDFVGELHARWQTGLEAVAAQQHTAPRLAIATGLARQRVDKQAVIADHQQVGFTVRVNLIPR